MVSRDSFRNRHPIRRPMVKNIPLTRFGKAKGNLRRNLFFPKRSGSFVAGEARAPPKTGPTIEPICQTRGRRLNALGCNDLCGTISATVVLRIPTFPLLAPENALEAIAHFKLREKPKSKLETIAQVMARRIIGFRPYLSLVSGENVIPARVSLPYQKLYPNLWQLSID